MHSTQLESLQRLEEARQQFDNAPLHLQKTTNDLDATLPNYSMIPELLENATMEADQISSSTASAMQIENLNTIRVAPNNIRDRSTWLVPINKLPLEVLLQIFRLTIQENHGSPYDYYISAQLHQTADAALLALTHTCTSWRSLVIATTSFWSKIFIDYENTTNFPATCNRVRTYLERAHGQPLDIEFHGGGISSPSEVAMIDTQLQDHFKHVKTLRLMKFQDPETLLHLIASLFTNGQPGSLQTLMIWSIYDHGFPARIFSTNSTLTRQRIDSILLPVQLLSLGGVYFDWDSLVYHNLTQLKLYGLTREKSPTLQQVLEILLACPGLEALRLQSLHILPSEGTSLEPAIMTKLAELDVSGINAEGLSLLLPMITSTHQGLSAKIDLYPDESNTGRIVQSFLSRNKVTRLYISYALSPNGIAGYLSAVPDLNVLILDIRVQPGDAILAGITHASGTAICPKLRTLYLIHGSLQNETVRAVVKAHPLLKKLHLIDCPLKPDYDELVHSLENVECTTRSGRASYWHRTLI